MRDLEKVLVVYKDVGIDYSLDDFEAAYNHVTSERDKDYYREAALKKSVIVSYHDSMTGATLRHFFEDGKYKTTEIEVLEDF